MVVFPTGITYKEEIKSAATTINWRSLLLYLSCNNTGMNTRICHNIPLKMQKERRKNKRFKDSENSLIFNLKGIAGKLINISLDGLAFIYIGDEFNTLGKNFHLDVLCASDAFYVKKIPCQLISIDNTITTEEDRQNRTIRCGVKFSNLPDQQKHLIKDYIKKISQRNPEDETDDGYPTTGIVVKSTSKPTK